MPDLTAADIASASKGGGRDPSYVVVAEIHRDRLSGFLSSSRANDSAAQPVSVGLLDPLAGFMPMDWLRAQLRRHLPGYRAEDFRGINNQAGHAYRHINFACGAQKCGLLVYIEIL
ncbi:hypothetical protein [Williamsia sp. CHRR-6]|uniref:hypothetical protein n=1 Tax=Williamsia sp. CHRR-6 TaxID=2835871 RepID=UPI001BDA03B5|nr:hypothetical protein [Williamsia sp. CHRR-6]MBT0566440.1 hypothetical protein [Williamsia sp. CHRR-6]